MAELFPQEAKDMENIVIAFMDGSAYYSSAATYLVSYHKNSNLTRTTLLVSNSRLHDPIKHPNILDMVPKQEVHGLYLATNSLI